MRTTLPNIRLTSALIASLPLLYVGNAWSHDTTVNCDIAAAKQQPIEDVRAELKRRPAALGVRLNLADMLLGVSCYDEAVHVLEDGVKLHPNDRNLQKRLLTARSFIGEREYLDKQPTSITSDSDAIFLRLQLRCKQIGDVQACDQALASRPNEAALWVAKGDALLKDKRAREALLAFNRAKQLNATVAQSGGTPSAMIDVTSRISAAQALLAVQSPPTIAPAAVHVPNSAPQVARTFSNIEPASRSN